MRCSFFLALLALPLASYGCASSPGPSPTDQTGGTSSGGAAVGVGGTSSGGAAVGVGGTSSGGAAAGGTSSGGAAAGGTSSGGAAAGGTSSGGAATSEFNCNDPEGLPRTYAAVRECVIDPGCASSICHAGHEPLLLIDTWEGFPRRSDHTQWDTLSDTLLNHLVTKCADSPIVDPGHPENSALIKALSRQCDDPEWGMPDGCMVTPCAPQTYIDFISEWIAQGAAM